MSSSERELSKELVEKFLSTISRLMTALSKIDDYHVTKNADPARKIGREMMEMMTDDVDWWVAGVPTNKGQLSKEEFPAMMEMMHKHAGGAMTLEPTGWTIDGNRIAVEAFSTMKHTSGRQYRNRYHWLFGIRDGKISAVHEYHDTEHQRDVFGSTLVASSQ